MIHSIETRNCKICRSPGTRINVGTFKKKSSKRWVGEDGRQWNGLICPKCQAEIARENMRKLRAERKANEVTIKT